MVNGCPKHNSPSAALLNHPEQATLPLQQAAIQNFLVAEAVRHAAETRLAVKEDLAAQTPSPTSSCESSPIVATGSGVTAVPTLVGSKKSKRAYVSEEEEEESGNEHEDARTNPNPKPQGNCLLLFKIL